MIAQGVQHGTPVYYIEKPHPFITLLTLYGRDFSNVNWVGGGGRGEG